MSAGRALPLSAGSPWRFLLSTVALSWAVWAVVVFAGPALPRPATTALLMAGFAVVAGCAIVAVHGGGDAGRVRAFWSSLGDVRRVPALAWGAAILGVPVLTFLAAAADAMATSAPITAGALVQAASRPLLLLRAFGFTLLAGPLFEELGWRGVALGPLQRRHGALIGALALGLVHALWHLPLFIAPAGYFHDLGLFTPAFWRFMADIVMFDILAAAIFNVANGSTLAAVVFHGSFNAAAALWVLAPAAQDYRDGSMAAVVALLVVATRGRLFLGGVGRFGGGTAQAA